MNGPTTYEKDPIKLVKAYQMVCDHSEHSDGKFSSRQGFSKETGDLITAGPIAFLIQVDFKFKIYYSKKQYRELLKYSQQLEKEG